ncbi:BRCA1-associated protein 2 containing protein [Loa loa]|uniref:BRCA1-associated protein 2 containing protein n=1 Tax=Loa loa TaxID=7209 RepID=A0A1I7VL84_LOALO|nr:BRCA1-associated protein 2 containing protein [Loa loa]EFO26116.1 BRCA1-associated protein 2 containing protein [Loa loa]
MSKVASIIIRLEIQTGAPFIKFESAGSIEAENKTQSEKKLMAERKKHKKLDARSKIEGNILLPAAVDKAMESVEQTSVQAQCLGNRKYSEVIVQTFSKDQAASNRHKSLTPDSQEEPSSVQTIASGPSLSSKVTGEGSDICNLSFFSGNPFVEKTSGILHFYKKKETSSADARGDCSILCMLGVPSLLSCRELLRFIAPSSQYITAMKVIRDSTPNQYMVIINFRSHEAAVRFYDEYNGITYNAIEPEECSLVFVEKIESVREEAGGSLPAENMTELPTCAVCLERMDDGVLTILCNHTFHAECLEQWADTTCPVCRHSQTPELVADQKCSVCGKTTDLWICLVCGNIGCGRYVEGHAYRHFETTSHTFTLEIGGERVWDYAGDNYVHRLIQSSPDGKMVEYRRSGISDSGENPNEKLESIQLEYTCLLTSQLEYQRTFYENKMNEQERLFSTLEKHNQAQVDYLEKEVEGIRQECNELKKTLASCTQQRRTIEKKHQNTQNKLNKALAELADERALNELLRSDQEKWSARLAEMEAKNTNLHEKYVATVNDLNEQIRDLMMHFEAEAKIQDAVEMNKVTEQEINEGSVVVADPPQRTPVRNRRRRKK